jgi:aminoglycoside phosphotransferase (APT) family kinase protein
MTLHKPATSLLRSLGPGTYEVLRVLQTQEALSGALETLCGRWQKECVIHGDVRLDNILVRSASASQQQSKIGLWVTDWEMIQFGDPAWDLAGAMQDLLVFWVSTMPLEDELAAAQMISGARIPLLALQRAGRAMWLGYREASGLNSTEASELLARAVAFSAARLNQSAYEAAHGANRLPGQSVILMQISANLLCDPERGQVELYGIPEGCLVR